MISNQIKASIKRLISKCARHIGHGCFKYISFLFDLYEPSQIELEILERIFTMGLYSDEVIDAASFTALDQNITSIVDFNWCISEVNNHFYENE